VHFAGLENINACLIGTNQNDGVILAFRGTLPPTNLDVLDQLLDWLQDFIAEPVAQPTILPPAATVHRGFWDAVDSLWAQIVPALRTLLAVNPQAKLYITGHSKGGAMAAIAAARLFFGENVQAAGVFLYAPARAGNSIFGSSFPANLPVIRYEHYLDIVPFVPPRLSSIERIMQDLLGDRVGDAHNWDYAPLGTLRFIEEDGTVVGDEPFLTVIRLGQILQRVRTLDFVSIAKAHGPWCQCSLSDGGYMLGVCPNSICAQPR
jgi:hypothetical protein